MSDRPLIVRFTPTDEKLARDELSEHERGALICDDDHFPRAGAPSSVSATRPSSWDEDDIRSTWIQNVSEGN